ncbi:MAG: metal-sensing transcriptional repressor [Lachnospiraceae bacterium]|nr:metal-sensing transcriptional repressor [Lachnospiraceae bacterium]
MKKEDILSEEQLTDNTPVECPCCSERRKKRDQSEYKDLINRLSRIEGQVRGIKRMLEEDCYCIDIMRQVSATTSALNSFNRIMMSNHLRSCVVNDLKEGNEETIEEVLEALQKMMK